jgi:hypothetical protein
MNALLCSHIWSVCSQYSLLRIWFITTCEIRFRAYCKPFLKRRSHETTFWPSFLDQYKIGSAKLKTSYLLASFPFPFQYRGKTAKREAGIHYWLRWNVLKRKSKGREPQNVTNYRHNAVELRASMHAALQVTVEYNVEVPLCFLLSFSENSVIVSRLDPVLSFKLNCISPFINRLMFRNTISWMTRGVSSWITKISICCQVVWTYWLERWTKMRWSNGWGRGGGGVGEGTRRNFRHTYFQQTFWSGRKKLREKVLKLRAKRRAKEVLPKKKRV